MIPCPHDVPLFEVLEDASTPALCTLEEMRMVDVKKLDKDTDGLCYEQSGSGVGATT